MFLTILIFLLVEKTALWARVVHCFTIVMIYVMQPIFYLNGDKNFRRRVLELGVWRALKKELFQNNAEIQPVNWFFKYFEIKKHTLNFFSFHEFLINIISRYAFIFTRFCKGLFNSNGCVLKYRKVPSRSKSLLVARLN